MAPSAPQQAEESCEILIVGGGLAESALAVAMSRRGADVVVVERDKAFRDRIRGEVLYAWGTAEADRLGITDLLLGSCALSVPCLTSRVGFGEIKRIDGTSEAPHRRPSLTFLHPAMQETLLGEAARAARVIRGATVLGLEPGPIVTVGLDGSERRIRARLVIGADGRDSVVTRLAGFERRRDPEWLLTSGALVACPHLPADAVHAQRDPDGGRMAILLVPSPGLARVYLIYGRDDLPRRLSGARDFPEMLRQLEAFGTPPEFLANADLCGPYASFDGAHRWVERPARDGIVLIGDAAAASDPAWGCGLSRTLRDVRLLVERLDGMPWAEAADDYALAHHDFVGRLRTVERTLAELWMRTGEDGQRARDAFKARNVSRVPIGLYGPELPIEELTACLTTPARNRLNGAASSDPARRAP